MKKLAILLLSAICLIGSTFAAYDKPTELLTDKVGILTPAVAQSVSAQLAQYQKDTTSQFIVYIANFEGQDALEAVTVKLAHEWQVGQAGKNNGVILFWFPNIHKVRIEVGYGLEGALPDSTAKDIISDTIVPYFKQKQWDQGVQAGVNAIIKATSKEFKAPIAATNDSVPSNLILGAFFLFFLIIGVIVWSVIKAHQDDKELENQEKEEEPTPYHKSYPEDSSNSFITGAVVGAALASRPEPREERVSYKKNRDDDDTPSRASYNSSSYSSDDSSSSSSSSDSGFSSGGGDFGGGGASGDY